MKRDNSADSMIKVYSYIGVVLLAGAGGITGYTLSMGWLGVVLGSMIGAGVGMMLTKLFTTP